MTQTESKKTMNGKTNGHAIKAPQPIKPKVETKKVEPKATKPKNAVIPLRKASSKTKPAPKSPSLAKAAAAPFVPPPPPMPMPENETEEAILLEDLNNVMYAVSGGIAALPEPEDPVLRVSAMYLGFMNACAELGIQQRLPPEQMMEDFASVIGRLAMVLQQMAAEEMEQQGYAPQA